MSTTRDAIPSKRDSVISATYEVESVRTIWRKLAGLLAPCENVKGQYRAIERATGIPARRQKDIRNGYLNQIPSHQARTLRNAYQDALARARRQLLEIERDAAEIENMVLAARDGSGALAERRGAAPGAACVNAAASAGSRDAAASPCD